MRNNNTKKMILNAILLAVGLILHYIFPAIGAGITPDLSLVMLFCIMIMNRDSYKTCLVAAIITGIFTAMATKFPMGQVPNIIDKLVTVNVMFVFMKMIYVAPFVKKLGDKANQIAIVLMTVVGTMVSGFTFLFSASIMVGLPGELTALFMAVVIPSMLINTIASIVLFNIISLSLKRTSYQLV
ncbi:tryptophan transporter [Peptostreptococcus faecalis]|uniref:tryptophan transporter n=1 Tax=Peptostreptococcus faecalis TaxID=2045015 RepID=UPI000C7DE013|nr:tryptophan transporter [Peptostreptococcus faecalis]